MIWDFTISVLSKNSLFDFPFSWLECALIAGSWSEKPDWGRIWSGLVIFKDPMSNEEWLVKLLGGQRQTAPTFAGQLVFYVESFGSTAHQNLLRSWPEPWRCSHSWLTCIGLSTEPICTHGISTLWWSESNSASYLRNEACQPNKEVEKNCKKRTYEAQ